MEINLIDKPMKKVNQYLPIILAIASTIMVGVTLLIILPILIFWGKLDWYIGKNAVTSVKSESLTYGELALY